jgi:hypothetical protein
VQPHSGRSPGSVEALDEGTAVLVQSHLNRMFEALLQNEHFNTLGTLKIIARNSGIIRQMDFSIAY